MKRMTRREFLGAGSQTAAALLFRHSFLRRLVPTGAFVESLWSGAITPNSARVNAKIDHDSNTVRLLVSTHPDLSNAFSFGDYTADLLTNNRMVSMTATGLSAGTTYYYGVESNGVLDGTRQGRFQTP